MLRLTLDTNCVIAGAQDQNHRQEIDRLVDLARAGHVNLWLTSAFAYDQAPAGAENRAMNLQWLSDRPFIGEVPGLFRLDTSPLGGPDVLASEDSGKADDDIRAILVPTLHAMEPVRAERRILDVHHLSAHKLAGNDAFITDDGGILKNRDKLHYQVGIRVLDPAQAVALAST
jgi:hypothetical protein